MAGGAKKKRTVHGWHRHRSGDRPTQYAFQDKNDPLEIYRQDDGRDVYVGPNGRTHVFEGDQHLTSFYTSRTNRRWRARSGRWNRVY